MAIATATTQTGINHDVDIAVVILETEVTIPAIMPVNAPLSNDIISLE